MKNSSLPIFEKLDFLDQKTKEVGFVWTHPQQLFDKVREECSEAEAALQEKDLPHLQEEMGDLLLAVCELCLYLGLPPQETLEKAAEKFQSRFETTVKLAQKEGIETFKGKSVELILSYWDRAKKVSP